MTDLTGQPIGNFQIVEKLGEGGMAEVYKAYQPSLERFVAIKFIHPLLATQADFRPRFEQEAKLLARLNHPHIVHVYDFGEAQGRLYLVMEYVSGGTLKEFLATTDHAFLPPERILEILSQLGAALDYAHAHNIIHLDIKPANILFTVDGRVLLNDFGLAKLVDTSSTDDGEGTSGTPDYSAPEQIRGEAAAASDRYALGVVLYEILTGRTPFVADGGLPVLIKHLTEPPPSPLAFRPDLPEAVEALLLKALAKDPAERYATASELTQSFREAFGLKLETILRVLDDEPPAPGEPPFQGLRYFDETESDRFFGREALIARLLGRLGEQHFLAVVVGASGSGKSSVVRAGLVPALKRGEPLVDGTQPPEGSEHWLIRVMTPTARPIQALAVCLAGDGERAASLSAELLKDTQTLDRHSRHLITAGANDESTGQRFVLVIDQFEELFTLCNDLTERQAFVDNVMAAVAPETGGPTTLIITLRADFYAFCAPYPQLREAIARHQDYIGPMTADELRQAIEEPARRGGWDLEPGLVEMLLKDVGADGYRQPEPGALPLLSHALLETWARRRGRMLTLRAYTESGGVRGAIAQTAETAYAALPAEQRILARDIFLRLTELGEGTQDTRRRARLDELTPDPTNAASIRQVLKTLVDARLVITDNASVEVAHEALIREWPTLRRWLDEDRAGLRLHHQLTDDAWAWEHLGRDPEAVYRGTRLAQASEWAAEHQSQLSQVELDFLAAAHALAEQEAAAREAQRQRELNAARQLAKETEARRLVEAERAREAEQSASRARRLSRLLAGIGGVAIIAALAAGFFGLSANENASQAQRANTQSAHNLSAAQVAGTQAVSQQQTAQAANTQAVAHLATAQSASTQALEQRNEAERQRQVALARSMSVIAQNLLASDQDLSLLFASRAVEASTQLGQDAILEAQTTLYTVLGTANYEHTFPDVGYADAIAFSPDGQFLAVAGARITGPELWTRTGEFRGQLETRVSGTTGGAITTIHFSPNGRQIIVTNYDNSARLWTASGAITDADDFGFTELTGHTGPVTFATFSPDGQYILTASEDDTARLWTTAGVLVAVLTGHRGDGPLSSTGPVFSPDSRRIITQDDQGNNRIWRTDGTLIAEPGRFGREYKFSPDGTRIVSSGFQDGPELRTADGNLVTRLEGHTGLVRFVTFSPDSTRLLTAGEDDTARLWTSQGALVAELKGHTNNILWAAFSPDGTHIITASDDKTARVWEGDGTLVAELSGHTHRVTFATISPDGALIVTGSQDGTARLWTATGQLISTLSTGHFNSFVTAKFSPDGKQIITVSDFGPARLWRVEDQFNPRLEVIDSRAPAAFDPEGNFIAALGRAAVNSQNAPDPEALLWDSRGVFQTRLGSESIAYSGLSNVWTVSTPGGARIELRNPPEAISRDFTPIGALGEFVAQKDQGFNAGGEFFARLSPDRKTVLTGGTDEVARLWAASDGALLSELHGHTALIVAAAFSPDGRWLVTASWDNTARLWTAEGAFIAELRGHADVLTAVNFSSDSTQFVTTSADGSARLWPVFGNVNEMIKEAARRVGRALTDPDCQLHLGQSCP